MNKLYGVDFIVENATRSQLEAAFHSHVHSIRHLFLGDEDFDTYLQALAKENLAVARLMNSTSNPVWKVDVEMIEPVPSEQIAVLLSKAGIVVARPSNEVAQYSSYLVYVDGVFAYEAELENTDNDPRLKPCDGQ